MLAVRLHAAGESLRLEEMRVPEPAGTEVRIRVAGCGVCRTDLHVVDGTQRRVDLPRTLGHEVSGYIDAVGPDAARPLRRMRLGRDDAVVVSGSWGCGVCAECRGGAEQRCERSVAPGFQADGGYAEAMIVPHPRHLVGVGRMDPVRAAPLADAGITPYRAVQRARPWLTDGARVLLIGCGALGQFALQYLRMLRGGRDLHVVVRELDPAKLEIAASLGADVGLLEGDEQMTRQALAGQADVVLDMVGTDATLAHGAAIVRPNGVLLLIGEAGGRISLGMDSGPLESWFTTVAWGSAGDLRDVVRIANRGRLTWDVATLPLREASQAHERLRQGRVAGRLVLVP
jgi:propanol-preferring alcohol dehydrogenase